MACFRYERLRNTGFRWNRLNESATISWKICEKPQEGQRFDHGGKVVVTVGEIWRLFFNLFESNQTPTPSIIYDVTGREVCQVALQTPQSTFFLLKTQRI